MTLVPILNRAADDPWYHLVPVGEYPHADSQSVQILDRAALTAIANRFTQEASKPSFAGLLIDQEHFSYDPSRSSEAFGWLKELQVRDSGLWGRIEWTDLGQEALANKRYKFISPVWMPADVQRLGDRRIRPLRLDSAGLTNNPNLRGMIPLVNRAGAERAHDSVTNTAKPMKSVASALGLAPEASEEAILVAVQTLSNRAKSAETDLGSYKNRAEKAEGDLKAARETAADATLEPYKNRIQAGTEAMWKGLILSDRDSAIATLKALPEPAAKQPGAVLNRASTQTPAKAATGTEADTAAEKARAARIGNRAAEIHKTNPRMTYAHAWQQAAAETP